MAERLREYATAVTGPEAGWRMNETDGSGTSTARPGRRIRRGRRVTAMCVAVVLSATASIASAAPVSARAQWTCPSTAPNLYQLTIDDPRLQGEVDSVGVCGDLPDTFLVINNTSTQPISFWSATPGSTYQLIRDTASPALRAKNIAIRSALTSAGMTRSFMLAGEAMQVTGRSSDFSWEFDAGLTISTLATDVAAGMAFNKLKRWASSGSKTRAAVTTCAFAATSAGATAADMDDAISKLLLGATPCAAAVERAGTYVEEETLLQRADNLQSKLTRAESFIKKVDSIDVVGRILLRLLRR